MPHVIAGAELHRRSSRTSPATAPASRSAAACPAGSTTPPPRHREPFTPEVSTRADDTLLLYFTSGTTAQPKLVEHTHLSYPVGHLSTMYWIGLQPGDVHLNISSPGLGQARVEQPVRAVERRGDRLRGQPDPVRRGAAAGGRWPRRRHDVLRTADGLADADPGRPRARGRIPLREVVGAGEPLNPEVIEQVAAGWASPSGTDSARPRPRTVGNTPGQLVVPGSMGRAMPGYGVVLIDPADR